MRPIALLGASWPNIAPANQRTAVDPAAGPALHARFVRARSSGVEHLTFNQRVDGSKPSGLAISKKHVSHPAPNRIHVAKPSQPGVTLIRSSLTVRSPCKIRRDYDFDI